MIHGIHPVYLLIGAGLSALYLAWFCHRGPSLLKTLVKTGAVAVPAVGIGLAGAPGWALAGLWACAAGDFLLSRPGENWLKAGIGAFAVGHILYVVAFAVQFGPHFGGDALAWAVPLALIGLGLSTEFWLAPRTGGLKIPVRFYVVLIMTMGAMAAQLPIPRATILAGALSFILSDLILSVELFVISGGIFGRIAPFLIWFFYYAAQVLLFMGFLG
ncbi:lysoplasmalogenase [Thalassovita mangrovi]|uniref:Lysoplasmalogenase n=1 Tax=Thalassovita mangrovi TaxID=2692236 RepID=A0A6L8LFA4_9RHOB|nr:lysoplasmalogenase [Thalassovita mangrovi]MYM54741.1 lysoplasmalogenase [Thalassovita mangrovi]